MRLYFTYRLSLLFALTMLGLTITGYLAWQNNIRLRETTRMASYTNDLLDLTTKTFSLIQDVETGTRGYIITGDETFLQPFYESEKKVLTNIQKLKTTTLDDPLQEKRMDSLAYYAVARIAIAKQQIQLRKANKIDAVIADVRSRVGKETMDRIRALITTIEEKQSSALQIRRTESLERLSSSNQLITTLFIALGFFVTVFFLTIANYFFLHKQHKQEAAEWNDDLERKIKNKTGELADYQYALDQSSIIAIMDQNGILRHINQNYADVSKYSEAELIENNQDLIDSGYHNKEFWDEMWHTIGQGKIWKGEIKNKAKDGSMYWVESTIVPFLDEKKKPFQFVIISNDISDRKSAEAELFLMKEELEKRVIVRTKELQDVNKELESFTYSVSHDLRAPLRSVQGFAQILKEEYGSKLDQEAQRLIAVVMRNSKKMGHLIDDLLAFSRLGKKELLKAKIDMYQMTLAISQELTYQEGTRSIDTHIDPLPNTEGDTITLKQVWINLISNALKYSRLKKHTIIHIGYEDAENEMIYYIKDNGIGFDMAYEGKLFGVFQRLHSEDEFEGTGVGLAIVHRIISKHGGRTWAEGKINEGATFYFALPKNRIQ